MYPLTGRRAAVADGSLDHPRPAETRLIPSPTDPDAHSLTCSCFACVTTPGLLMPARSGPGPGSRQGHGTARTTHPAAHARWRAENGDEDGDGSDDALTGRVGALVAVTESAQGATLTRADGLTGEDVRNLNAVLAHALAANTQANYRGQWQRFAAWALTRGVRALPAAPAHVAAYLAERIERAGHRPATLRMATAAIACIHRAAGLADPCAAAEVRRALSGAIRKAGRRQKQAAALTAEALAMIEATAAQPRPGRGGRPESRATATNRGRVDLALISLMRDALLRVSEAAALTWADIGGEPDGTGRLLIRRSKTDPEGEGAVAFLSVSTMARLAAIRAGAAVGGRVFGLCRKQLATRIKQAALAAGLGEGFSGHSPRVGMARDLARAGVELPRLMTAGRWRSPTMPALYTRNETAGTGAVAQFYGGRRHPTGAGKAAARKTS